MTPTTVRDNLKALSAYLLESTGKDFMYQAVEQAIVLLGEGGGDWVLVPREPTEEMLAAANKCIRFNKDPLDDLRDDWRAMLAAAVKERRK